MKKCTKSWRQLLVHKIGRFCQPQFGLECSSSFAKVKAIIKWNFNYEAQRGLIPSSGGLQQNTPKLNRAIMMGTKICQKLTRAVTIDGTLFEVSAFKHNSSIEEL
jgi:hypothetical protein